jgi:hypothetical protein
MIGQPLFGNNFEAVDIPRNTVDYHVAQNITQPNLILIQHVICLVVLELAERSDIIGTEHLDSAVVILILSMDDVCHIS